MDFFMYLSVIEGFMIVCMLGWEIFWLRRMYQVLQSMPTSEQFAETVKMLKNDRDAIVASLGSVVSAFDPIKTLLSGGAMGMIGGLFSGVKKE